MKEHSHGTWTGVKKLHKKTEYVRTHGEIESSEAWIVPSRGPPSVRGDLAPPSRKLSPSRLSSDLGLNLDISRLQARVHAHVRGDLLVDRPTLELE